MKQNLYVGLVHYPVYNKFQEVVTTSITNLDIHDIARSCKTFGAKKFFIINPLETQKKILERVLKFWKTEIADFYNTDRVQALSIIEYSESIRSVIERVKNQEEVQPLIISTTAAIVKNLLSFKKYRKK